MSTLVVGMWIATDRCLQHGHASVDHGTPRRGCTLRDYETLIVEHEFAKKCWFLSGATASGKTGVGIELAGRLDAEIVSMDSMALYRRMDIGTAKPTLQQRQAVPHHLLDVIEPHQEYSLAQYIETVKRCVAGIQARGRQVLFVGGTPLYLKGLLRGIFEGPAADQRLRDELAAEARRHGGEWLHRRLSEIDPVAAGRLHPNNWRRLIRAIEVFEKTGRPISRWQEQFDTGLPAEECKVFVLDWSREELYTRINRRVEEMFAEGLLDEVRSLLKKGGTGILPVKGAAHGQDGRATNNGAPLSKTAAQAVGYREVIEHLRGDRGLEETVELVKMHTRRFAKRQGTWFRGLEECRFVPLCGEVDAVGTARLIMEMAG